MFAVIVCLDDTEYHDKYLEPINNKATGLVTCNIHKRKLQVTRTCSVTLWYGAPGRRR